jgi:sugar fermentation stimulation protein A
VVLLERAANPDRKLKFTWLAVERPGGWVGVETGLPNRVVAEAARQDVIPGLSGLAKVRTEVGYGHERSRIDVLAEDFQGKSVFIEVKNTTLKVDDWVLFPDAVTERGTKHLRELQAMVAEGHRAAIAFFVHRTDVACFDAAREVDPVYAQELDRAAEAGVTVLPLAVRLITTRQADGLWSLGWELPGLLPWVRRG